MFRGTALRDVPEMGEYGGNPRIPPFLEYAKHTLR